MTALITESSVVESMALRSDEQVEAAISESLRHAHLLAIEQAALPFIANILSPEGELDRLLNRYLRSTTLPLACWKKIAMMARQGSRTRSYAESQAESKM